MNPLAPEVVGPLSVCSTSVEVRGNIVGATINILVAGTVVASHVSKTPDHVYAIGVTLQANQPVTATQTIGGQTSPASLPIVVQDTPSQLSALTVRTLLHTCGRAVRVTGAVPGAKIDVQIGAQNVGSGKAARGWAGIEYDPGQAAGQPLTLNQVTCNNLTASQSTVAPVAAPMPLPAPVIQTPLFECQSRITISGVVDGAYVELYRNNDSTPEDRFIFGISEEFRWIKPLVKNDVIKVRQGFSCKEPAPPLETTSPYTSATVEPVSSLHAPKFLSTPCPGSTYVTLEHLVPGARVVLSQNGEELGETDAPDVVYTFATPALKAGATLEAHMEMCNGKGPSATVTVGNQAIGSYGLLLSPLYACAAFVELAINGDAGNYLVYLTNKNGQQISPYHNLIGMNTLVPVFPSLVAGDQITCHVQGCGGAWITFGPNTVLTGPPQPTIQPLYPGNNKCLISAMAGFILDVYVNNTWRGSALSHGIYGGTVVPLSVTLQMGDQVYCTQTVCGVASKPSNPITVTTPVPKPPTLLDPPNGADAVLLQPALIWKDPGSGTPAAATSYQVLVTQAGNPVINESLTSTSYTSPLMLETNTEYKWTVESINAGGQTSALAPSGFLTEAPPPPPTAGLKLVSPIMITLNSVLHGIPFPREVEFNAAIKIVNQGNAASSAYSVVFKFLLADDLMMTAAQKVTAQMPALPAGASTSTSANVFLTTAETVRIDILLMVNNQQLDEVFLDG